MLDSEDTQSTEYSQENVLDLILKADAGESLPKGTKVVAQNHYDSFAPHYIEVTTPDMMRRAVTFDIVKQYAEHKGIQFNGKFNHRPGRPTMSSLHQSLLEGLDPSTYDVSLHLSPGLITTNQRPSMYGKPKKSAFDWLPIFK